MSPSHLAVPAAHGPFCQTVAIFGENTLLQFRIFRSRICPGHGVFLVSFLVKKSFSIFLIVASNRMRHN